MRSMGHPDYVYQPWSDERRERASEVAKRRVGAMPGHRLWYGVQVPDGCVERYKRSVEELARKRGRVAAASFLSDMQKSGWPAPRTERPWTPIEARHLRQFHEQGLSAREIAAKMGRTRNAILGKIFRSGLSKPKAAAGFVEPPPGLARVPAKMIWKLARDHMESKGRDANAEAAAFCIAPCFGIQTPEAISSYLGIPRRRALVYAERLRANGIWGTRGPLSLERYMDEGEESAMTLILDALVCLGKVRRTTGREGEDLWQAASRARD